MEVFFLELLVLVQFSGVFLKMSKPCFLFVSVTLPMSNT